MIDLKWAMATFIASSAIAVSTWVDAPTKLIWNASASTPIGFYSVEPAGRLEVTDLVAVDAPEPIASFLADGGYLPRDTPLLKRVLGLPGQTVCRTGLRITVDELEMGMALERDRIGRPLPDWQGCRVVAGGEIFLMNWEVSDSLDGRYFGPIPASSVIGRAVPLWTDEDGEGRFEWRAATR
ncbi:conjugative transfer signal peptidase TraF [Paracoccus aminovorans]|uniref:Conjugative transfer signal peptidase TraF n=1 Tax=Paracoccus aminovorans TaxID=34004 RepID=A0A1I3DIH5_9RHOB|nr:S26 family signal peptidase [Paracoccus aminovorans]PKP72090.1 MAG: S26 family signal peptidase [Alphaproteobacteria bacterium HGW-Alphaproteobacteria-5]SFH86550.1 conjugative transfer signal peptidase TraF [Paracoccus aminovorans]